MSTNTDQNQKIINRMRRRETNADVARFDFVGVKLHTSSRLDQSKTDRVCHIHYIPLTMYASRARDRSRPTPSFSNLGSVCN